VVAVGDGEIVHAGWDGPFGRHLKIGHGSEFVTAYAHLDRIASGIRTGTKVKRGQVIGYVGTTGLSTGPHLHFSISRNGKFVDPLTTVLPAAPTLSEPALMALRGAVGDVEIALTASSDDDGSVRVANAR
jgi:murein DD-endopeptidase MepM/ murein hydrolase activator NlpD